MEYCKYHPLSSATYECHFCHVAACDLCINDNQTEKAKRCYVCDQQVERLATASNIIPFWRRLQESFRYPMNNSSLTLIISISVLMLITSFLPFIFALILDLALIGSIFKYGFSCLKNTAAGEMTAPDLKEAYDGGLGVAGKLILMMFFMMAIVYGCYSLLGPVVGDIVAIIMVIGFPAVLIGFGLTEDVFEAVNPINMFRLISAVGLPYGLLLAFIMIMSGSVGVISELIGDGLSVISTILQSIVLNYYLIVIMHIMGYMIFQYQNELGFSTSADESNRNTSRNEKDNLLANIQVHLKEGYYQKVNNLFLKGIKNYVNDKELYKSYFDFLIATKDPDQLNNFATHYFNYLQATNQHDRLNISYKQILSVNSNYQPETAELRLLLAKACRESGEPKLTIKLLNGLHKAFPEFDHLVEAYELLADSFEDLHNMAEQAFKCRAFVENLKLRKPAQKSQKRDSPKPSEMQAKQKPKALFSSIDLSLEAAQSAPEPAEQVDDPRKKDLPPLDFY